MGIFKQAPQMGIFKAALSSSNGDLSSSVKLLKWGSFKQREASQMGIFTAALSYSNGNL